MDIASWENTVLAWFETEKLQILTTIVVFLIYYFLDRFSTPRIVQSADDGNFRQKSATKAIRVCRSIFGIIGILFLLLIWGFDFSSMLVFTTTALTLLGVALFASWSLLSNVTAYFVLLIHPSFRRGNFVRIIDFDNYVEGYISELNLFNTKLLTENREAVVYPNNMLLGRPMMVNPRNRLNGVGKLCPDQPVIEATEKQQQG